MSHLNPELKRKQRHCISIKTYGQCISCWNHNEREAIFSLPYLKNQHIKYMNNLKRMKRNKDSILIKHPIISVKPYEMIPFIDYYPIDNNGKPIINSCLDWKEKIIEMNDNKSKYNFYYGSNKWGHQQIKKQISINRKLNEYYRNTQNKTFKWKLKKRKRSKRSKIKNMKYIDHSSLYPNSFSIYSNYYKKNIKQNICSLCHEYCYPSKPKVINCESCIKFVTSIISKSCNKYVACESCWKYYNFCKSPPQSIVSSYQQFRDYCNKLSICPFIACIKCGYYQSRLCEIPVIKMYQVQCVACIIHLKWKYGFNDDHYPFICNLCAQDTDSDNIIHCHQSRAWYLRGSKCANNRCIVCKDEYIIDDYNFDDDAIDLRRFVESLQCFTTLVKKLKTARCCDNCLHVACWNCTVCPMKETGILYKPGDSRILCLNCAASYIETNFEILMQNQCERILDIGSDVMSIITKYIRQYVFECCNPKCNQDIFIKDWFQFRSRLVNNYDYHKFYYYYLEKKYIKYDKREIENECRWMNGKWLRIFCQLCTNWSKDWHRPQGLHGCDSWMWRYIDEQTRRRKRRGRGGRDITKYWKCENGNYDMKRRNNGKTMMRSYYHDRENGQCLNHYKCNQCDNYISNKHIIYDIRLCNDCVIKRKGDK